MQFPASSSVISADTLLWLAASVMAAAILLGTVHRRRVRLTETLKAYVERSQGEASDAASQNSNTPED